MAAVGWVRRVRLDFGDGSLLVITRAGVRRVLEEHDVPEDVEEGDELREVSPTMRAHVVASAWTAARRSESPATPCASSTTTMSHGQAATAGRTSDRLT